MDPNFEIEFEKALREKKHKQILDKLVEIYEKIPTKVDVELPEQKDFDYDRMESIIERIKIEPDQTIPASISTLVDVIIEKQQQFMDELKALKAPKAPKSWTFKVTYDNQGRIDLVKANSK